ncbi:MAG: ParB/RepB/Spo0J family partition protein [Clostridia bacterium]|nr:ParB/RepB/Spo0J family partition protein [Clostridia bacterium]
MLSILKKQKGETLIKLPLEDIAPNKNQPRQYFDDETLEELKNSILEFGLLQPITVRRTGGGYELIAGERRFRAAQLAGLEEIPAIVVESDEKKSAVLSLLENLQREDLTFFEIAQSYERLIREQGMTQSEVAEKIGRSRSSVANKLRLLKLSPIIRKFIRDYDLTERHARALLRLGSETEQLEAVKQICLKSLTVAETEELISSITDPPPKKPKHEAKGANSLSFFKNTVRKAIDIMKKGGVEAEMEETDFDWGTEYKIHVKK